MEQKTVDTDPEYVSIPLIKIFPDSPLPGDIFLFLGGHFVKYKNSGDAIPKDRYDKFILQKLQYIFILENDRPSFQSWTQSNEQEEVRQIVKNVGEDNQDLVQAHVGMKRDYFDFLNQDITEESVKNLLNKTRGFITKVKEKVGVDKFLAKIMSYDQGVADHSTNVANLSTFLAMNIGYNQQVILENIYTGALLHDYGKSKIAEKYPNLEPDSKKYQKALRRHPEIGKTTLLLDSGLPDEALRIIAEHHEQNDGNGYPKGLKGNRIYELTKIVSIANDFDNHVANTEGNPKKRFQYAITQLEKDQGHLYDPKILGKCLRVLENI